MNKIDVVKNKNFILLMIGSFASLVGSGIQSFALSLYILKITGSVTQFATVLTIGIIPRLIFSTIGGVFADWFDRKKIIVYLDIARGIIICGLLAINMTGQLGLVHIYVSVILLSTISAFFSPAIATVIPTVVDREELMQANSINSLLSGTGQLIAPIIGGLLLSFSSLSVIFVINALSFLLSGIMECFIKIPRINKKTKYNLKEFGKSFKEGLEFTFQNRLLSILIVCCFMVNLSLYSIFSVGLTFILKVFLSVSDMHYGVFESIVVSGSIMGPLIAIKMLKGRKLEKIYSKSLLIITLLMSLMTFIVSPIVTINTFTVYLVLCFIGFLVSLIVGLVNISMNTIFQKQIPNDYLGRVSSVVGMLTALSVPIGQMMFGYMFEYLNVYIPVFVAMSLVCFAKILFDLSNGKNLAHEHRETQLNKQE